MRCIVVSCLIALSCVRVRARRAHPAGCVRGRAERRVRAGHEHGPTKRGTASSGCGASLAPAIRPLESGSNTGKRPPRTSPCTSAVMNTVLPARDRPVTPSRTVGLNRWPLNSAKARAASLVCSMKSETAELTAKAYRTGCAARGMAKMWPRMEQGRSAWRRLCAAQECVGPALLRLWPTLQRTHHRIVSSPIREPVRAQSLVAAACLRPGFAKFFRVARLVEEGSGAPKGAGACEAPQAAANGLNTLAKRVRVPRACRSGLLALSLG